MERKRQSRREGKERDSAVGESEWACKHTCTQARSVQVFVCSLCKLPYVVGPLKERQPPALRNALGPGEVRTSSSLGPFRGLPRILPWRSAVADIASVRRGTRNGLNGAQERGGV